jgi:hypothetical protein
VCVCVGGGGHYTAHFFVRNRRARSPVVHNRKLPRKTNQRLSALCMCYGMYVLRYVVHTGCFAHPSNLPFSASLSAARLPGAARLYTWGSIFVRASLYLKEGRKGRRRDERMDGRTNGRTEVRKDERTNGGKDGRKEEGGGNT